MSYAYYQPNPCGKSVGDCTVRALSKALDQSWGETYVGLALEGFIRGDLPNADSVWGPYLKAHGFTRHFIPDDGRFCGGQSQRLVYSVYAGEARCNRSGRRNL